MFQKQSEISAHACPCCGSKLSVERDLLRCATHGDFFAYSPTLLVRAPRRDVPATAVVMPWEPSRARAAR